jgi:hypothetical protein
VFFSPAREYVKEEMRSGERPQAAAAVDVNPYLTDGRTLYRVVAPLRSRERHDFALLEDCATLEVFAFTAELLSVAALTAVIPAGNGKPASPPTPA